MYPKNSGGCSKFPGRLKFRPSIAQTAFVSVVTPRAKRQDDAVVYTDNSLFNVACGSFPNRTIIKNSGLFHCSCRKGLELLADRNKQCERNTARK